MVHHAAFSLLKESRQQDDVTENKSDAARKKFALHDEKCKWYVNQARCPE
jgi:hypothetical protein